MEWFSQSWIWVLLFIGLVGLVGLVGMHTFGHGGHGARGGHGAHGDGSAGGDNAPKPEGKDVPSAPKQRGHQH